MLFERNAKRLKERCNRAVLGVTERQPKGELAFMPQVQLSCQGNVAVRCVIELPVHPKIVGEICPSITSAHVAARCPRKVDRAAEGQPYAFFLRHKDFPACDVDHVTVVTPSTHLKMRCTERIEMQLRDECFIAGELGVLKNAV